MRPKPKKRLGQHFLVDKNIQRKIIDLLELKSSDIILEVGPGRGELTRLLAKKVSGIYCVEIDADLCPVLRNNLKQYTNAEIINQDILKFNLKKRLGDTEKKIKAVGNIPYYITSPILEYLIKFRYLIEAAFITVQKEFAARMSALPGTKNYGAFSCFVQYYFETKAILNIKKTCFIPMPKVDSCLLRLKTRNEAPVKAKDEKLFFKIIRTAFNYRRKTLRNSLKDTVPRRKLEEFFTKYRIDSNIRPEALSLRDFANLANM